MKKIIPLMVLILLMLTGCGKDSGDAGEVLFSCNSSNMIAIKSVRADENKVTACFDLTKMGKDSFPSGLYYWTTTNDYPSSYDYIYVYFKDETYVRVDDAVIDISAAEMNISMNIENEAPQDIVMIKFACSGTGYLLDLENRALHTDIWGGECCEKLDQTCDSTGSWSEVQHDTVYYPLTEAE